MRTISYKCDRCGKPLSSKSAIKLNTNIQKGADGVEKKSHDFCSPCFVIIKSAFAKAIKIGGVTINADNDNIDNEEQVNKPVSKCVGGKEYNKFQKINGGTELTTGPISEAERSEILRLFVEEELNVDQIAAKIGRLPRGINRTINSATKSGEIDRLRDKLLLEDEQDDEAEKNYGSGASNAGIIKDAYTNKAKTKTIDGRKYDIGGVIALAKAGWSVDKIAEERHYDDDIVRLIIEKYM